METDAIEKINKLPLHENVLPGQRQTNHLLVLDDNQDILSTVGRLAIHAGYTFTGVDRAETFIEKFNGDSPSFVILDVVLGTQDVLSVVDFLGKQQFSAAVVLMSGYDHRMLRAVAEVARDHGLHIAGTVEKGAGLDRLTHLLGAHFVGAR